jgi:hypothetical protein
VNFDGPVRVPENAGGEIAVVVLSFPDWKEGHVAPTRVEVPIRDDPPVLPEGR